MSQRHRRTRKHADGQDVVSIGGRQWPVIDRLSVGRRTYLVLERTGNRGRGRFMVFDPHAGPDGALRAVLSLPRTPAAEQHVRILKRLSAVNNNLPAILDYRAQDDALFIVLTWVRGPDLRSFLDEVRDGRKPRPSATEAVRLVRGLAHGISQLHRRHAIVHGDIKPANLILARDPTRLVTIDFGSAWSAERTLAREAGDGITAAYAPPEMYAARAQVDARADQFSASVVLYELLTLRLPYEGLGGQAGRDVCAAHRHATLISPSRLSPDRGRLPANLWREIDRVVTKGLALDRDQRYETNSQWLNDLDALHFQSRPGIRLSPGYRRLTQVTQWIADRLRRK